jgi:soluble lytic murein transglycosylase-like protein
MGVMQLMPATWAEIRSLHGLGADPHDPHDNILAGTAYLRAMYDRFGYPGLFAAYNAGPSRYAEHLANRRPLPPETVAYVMALGEAPSAPAAHRTQSRGSGVFVALGNRASRDSRAAPPGLTPSSLFIRLSTASAVSE